MEGFDYQRVRAVLRIPDHYRVEMMAAVGRPRDPRELDREQRHEERPNGRKALDEIAFAGAFPADTP